MVPRETVSFVFPRVLIVSGNIRTRGKTKLTSFPRDHTISALSVYLDYPFNNHSKTNKQTTERATTTELYPGRDTFVFDQEHVTKNQPIRVLVLLSEILGIEKIFIQGYRPSSLHTVEIIFLSDFPLALG